MSFQIANVDLSAATVGTAGSIPIGQATPPPTIAQQMRPTQNTNGVHLFIWNESGCGLTCLWPETNQTFTLPAGAWRLLNVPPSENQLNYLVSYIIPNAPVSRLLADMYLPGEPIDDMGVLGNSPIGVSGQVATSTGQSIKNDGNVPATQIIEATPSDQGSSSVSLNNDASGFLQVLSANVLRKILNVVRGNNTTGKASIQVGDSGDATITTFYGSLQGAQPANVGAITTAASYGWVPTGVGSGFLAALDINPAGATVNKHWAIAFNGGDGHVQIQNLTDNIDALDIGSDGSVALAGRLTVNGGNVALQSRSAGGGAAGATTWEGTVDPGASAGEGDIWLNG